MIKKTMKEWANRTGCFVSYDIKSRYGEIRLSAHAPYMTMYGQACDEVTEISAICELPVTDWGEDFFISPAVVGIKKYTVIDWLNWLKVPITIELEKDRTGEQHVEYYVYDDNTQTRLTPFVL